MPVLYLRSYDLYREVLEYDTVTGAYRIIGRDSCAEAFAFGRFTREGSEVLGVYGSPQGPVFFLGRRQVRGVYGMTSASVSPAETVGYLRFVLTYDAEIEFIFDYRERHGLGVNPYDNEPEDVDLAALIARGAGSQDFYQIYTRPWPV